MRLALVVTTLGRIQALRALADSLVEQLGRDDRLVLVAQGNVAEVEALASDYAGLLPVQVTTSARGATLGRNTGVAALDGDDAALMFPNDTTVVPAGTLDAVRAMLDAAGDDFLAAGLACHDERGPKSDVPAVGTPLDRFNLWSVIEMGLIIRRGLFDELGGFSLEFGPGQDSPWQAGEVSDLLLRALAHRPELASQFIWLPTSVHVDGISTAFGLDRADRRRKLRTYGRGTAQVFARHPYPWWWRFAYVGAGLLAGVRSPAPVTATDGWWMFIGRLEGMRGRTFGSTSLLSTTR